MDWNAQQILATLEAIDDHLRDVVALDACLREITASLLWTFGCDRGFCWSPHAPELGGLSETFVASRVEDDATVAQLALDDPAVRALIDACLGDGAVHHLDGAALTDADLGVHAMLLVAVQPRLGPTWIMGVQFCRPADPLDRAARVLRHLAARLAEVATCVAAIEQLRAAEDREASLLSHAAEAVMIVDVGTQRIVQCSAEAERALGWPEGQLLGAALGELNPELQGDGARSEDRITVLLAEVAAGEAKTFDWTHRRRGGDPIACSLEMAPLPSTERLLVRVRLRPAS